MSDTGKSPYSTEIAKSSLDYDMNPMAQMLQYQREEEEAKAPLTLPYEMSELPQLLADMVDSGFNAAKIMENVLKSQNFQGDLKKLDKLKQNIEKMVVYLMKNVDSTMVTFTIGAKDRLSLDNFKN
jgi:hypothetical protein